MKGSCCWYIYKWKLKRWLILWLNCSNLKNCLPHNLSWKLRFIKGSQPTTTIEPLKNCWTYAESLWERLTVLLIEFPQGFSNFKNMKVANKKANPIVEDCTAQISKTVENTSKVEPFWKSATQTAFCYMNFIRHSQPLKRWRPKYKSKRDCQRLKRSNPKSCWKYVNSSKSVFERAPHKLSCANWVLPENLKS